MCLDCVTAAPFEMALAADKFWPQNKVLRVKLLGGTPTVRTKVQQYAQAWHPYINIRFDFVDDPDAEIRVAFVPNGLSWSALGTDALKKVWFPNETMNLGWLTDDTPDEEYSRVVTHEFGHALGCIHEHQNPDVNIPWNKDAVYRYYSETQGWSKDKVDQNLFRHWEGALHSGFDNKSIMLYAVPKELTNGGFEVGSNRVLSDMDKTYIAKVYPPNA
jgi:hypothetical protein